MEGDDQTAAGPHNMTRVLLAVLAIAGVGIAVEGLGKGTPSHQWFAAGLGVLLITPLALSLLLGERWLRIQKRLVFAMVPTLAVLALLEIGLRLANPAYMRVPAVEQDPELGHALVPGTGDSDAWGFRNPTVPERARIVCLGDSQTYGNGVDKHESWPAALGELTGETVYNMSFGGYGPMHYLAMQERAMSLRPDWIAVGLFLGNDIVDAHRLAALDTWREYRDPQITYAPYSVTHLEVKTEPNLAMSLLAGAKDLSYFIRWAEFLVKSRLQRSQALGDAFWQEPGAPRYVDPQIGTLFMPEYRLEALRPTDPAVVDGLRITKRCLEEIASRCRREGVSFALLVLHTKEYYYYELGGDPVLQTLAPLASAEREMSEAILQHARALGWTVVDPTHDVLTELRAGQALWPPTSDGHFNPAGQRRIAEAVAGAVGLW